ncbi:hypothetical protein [uncultured Chloroflexus sp.]|nr:hypothetical protein [uncultured Chloroflexus sp.]
MQYKRNFETTDSSIPRCEYRSPVLKPLSRSYTSYDADRLRHSAYR